MGRETNPGYLSDLSRRLTHRGTRRYTALSDHTTPCAPFRRWRGRRAQRANPRPEPAEIPVIYPSGKGREGKRRETPRVVNAQLNNVHVELQPGVELAL